MAKLHFLFAVSAVLLIVGNSASALKPAPKGLLESVIGTPEYSTLVTALKITNLVPALSGILKTSKLTIFAPNNAAFAKIPAATFKNLTTTAEGKAILADILKYHVVKGSFPYPLAGNSYTNLLDLTLYITSYWGGWWWGPRSNSDAIFVNNVRIIKRKQVYVPQGVVHGIDTVLIPPEHKWYFNKHYVYNGDGYYGNEKKGTYWNWWWGGW